jgi:hypothetical protein
MNIENEIKESEELVAMITALEETEIDNAFMLAKQAIHKAFVWNKIGLLLDKDSITNKTIGKTEFKEFCRQMVQIMKVAHHMAKDIWKKSEML